MLVAWLYCLFWSVYCFILMDFFFSCNNKCRWDDDVVFKNQARGEAKTPKRFINDTIRSDFHRKFLQRYMKWLKGPDTMQSIWEGLLGSLLMCKITCRHSKTFGKNSVLSVGYVELLIIWHLICFLFLSCPRPLVFYYMFKQTSLLIVSILFIRHFMYSYATSTRCKNSL